MDSSDQQNMKIQQQIDPFKSIIPTRPRNHPGGHGKFRLNSQARQVRQACLKLMNEILDDRIQDMAKKVFSTIVQNWNGQNSIIIALNLKRNQKDDLQKIVRAIPKCQRQQGNQNQKIKLVHIHEISKQDVRDLALQIQMNQDQRRQKSSVKKHQIFDTKGKQVQSNKVLQIYVNRKITNLGQQNIHVFQNTVINGAFAVIIPTFQTLKIVDGQGIIKQSQKYFFEAYNNKELFIQFFYRSIVSRNIMAYLPKQILGLIKMYDYFPLSYQQGCFQLIYAIQLFNEKLRLKGKPKKKPVQMKELIRIFNRTWKFIWNDEAQVNKYNFQMLSYCILDEKSVYTVSQKKIQYYVRLNKVRDSGVQDFSDKKVYEKFQNKFKQKLLADQSLKHLAKIFDQFQQKKKMSEKIIVNNKKTKNREVGLGFTAKSFKQSQKEIFQDKITKLFKIATQDVRKQAQYVSWDELRIFDLRRPSIVRETFQGILQDHEFRDVFNLIRSYSSLPMVRLLDSFKKIQIGRLIYILRCLQLKGLIQLNKNTLKPSLITNYYDKSQYWMKGEDEQPVKKQKK